METMRTIPMVLLLGATLALGCDEHATSTTTTTSAAADSGAKAVEDLKQGTRDLGAAAEKAAVKVADEAKKEVRELDVKITTGADAGRP
jgi:hypothetical protein